jgi:competence protein ComEC
MPALWVACLLGTGIWAGAALPGLPIGALWAFAGGAALCCALGYGLRDRVRAQVPLQVGMWTALALLLIGAGALRYRIYTDRSAQDIGILAAAYGSVEVSLQGRIRTEPEITPAGSLRFLLEAERLSFPVDTPVVGFLLVRLLPHPEKPFPSLAPGDRVRLDGVLEFPPQARNPGAMDYRTYLMRRRVHALLVVAHPELLLRLGAHRSVWQELIVRLRRGIREAIERHVPASSRSLVLAIWLGDRSQISEDLETAFARAGTLHVLAVSGMNVALLAWLVYATVGLYTGRRPARRPIRIGLVLLVVALYVALTGAEASIVRAGIMAALLLMAELLERPWMGLNTLGAAACLSLWWRPSDLWDVGWQLSFSAMLGLVRAFPVLAAWTKRERWPSGLRAVGDLMLVSLAAQLLTAPVLLVHFGQISWVGPLANLVAVPATWVIFVSGAAVVGLDGLPWSFAADWAGKLSHWGGLLLQESSRWAAALPGASGFYAPENGLLICALLGGIGALLLGDRPAIAWRLLLAAGLCYGAGRAVVLLERGELEVVFLDVGQGDAAAVRTPGGRVLVIDAGPKTEFWDAGRRALLPLLRRWNARAVDVLLLSHAHADHTGGSEAIRAELPVRRFIGPEARLFRGAGDTLDLGPELRLYLLHPAPEDSLLGENDRSFVLLLQYGRTRFLWAGDLGAEGEGRLLRRWGNFLQAHVVKAPHHGSGFSSQPDFIRATRPLWVVISCGRRNPFGHPDPQVLRRWQAAGARLWRTDERGAAVFRSDGRRVVLVSR